MEATTDRRDLGAFYTPARTADLMVELLGPGRGDRVLDPAAGDGALVAALRRAGVPAERITAWDLDPAACGHLRRAFPGVTVEQRDTLLETDLDRPGRPRWDRVIANPPYLNKASGYVRAHRTALRARFGAHVGASETSAMFLFAGLRLLADDGALVYIVSDTIRTLATHERLRRAVLGDHRLRRVVAAPDGLFRGASVRTVILDVAAGGAGPTAVLDARTGEDVYEDGGWHELPAGTARRIDGAPIVLVAPPTVVALFDQPGRLRDHVRGHIGMHTRGNRRWLAAISGSDLAARYDRRRRRADEHRVISAAEAASDRWRPYLKLGGDRDFHAPLVEHVDWRAEAREHYVIPSGEVLFGRAGLAVSGVSRRLSARVMPAGCYWDSNKVIGLIPDEDDDRDLLLGLLNSDLYTFIAKHLLNDSSSLQLSDLWKLPIPPLAATDRDRIATIASACVTRRRSDPSARLTDLGADLDEAVHDAAGIAPEDRDTVRAELSRAGRRRR